jgi:nucleoid DNA-binding protein
LAYIDCKEVEMATLIQAVTAFRPRVVSKGTIGLDILSLRLTHGSLVKRSIASMVLEDLLEQIRNALLEGNTVNLPGVGRFGVSIGTDGRLRANIRVAAELRNALATPGAFKGDILRRDNIGLSTAEIVALWDEEHPEDPVELPPGMDLAA